jgi:DNA-binding response OmpR family regulator
MCTANDEPVYQVEAKGKGALGILPKPANSENLSAILKVIDAAIAAKPATTTEGEDMNAQIEQMRRELTAHFDEQLAKLRTDLHKREGEFAQALLQKIAQDILPNMLRQGAEQLEQRIVQRLSK